jgi:hypothetical protein
VDLPTSTRLPRGSGKLPISIFYTGKWWPNSTLICAKLWGARPRHQRDVANTSPQRSDRDKAFTLLAEIFLMQHSCHWYCKSLGVASARLVMRHQTPYEKVLDSVSPGTRQAYTALIAR